MELIYIYNNLTGDLIIWMVFNTKDEAILMLSKIQLNETEYHASLMEYYRTTAGKEQVRVIAYKGDEFSLLISKY